MFFLIMLAVGFQMENNNLIEAVRISGGTGGRDTNYDIIGSTSTGGELRNPCHFDTNFCQNMGECRPIDDVNKKCDCQAPFDGQQCELINPCLIQEVCTGSHLECFPCRHGGKCESTQVISPVSTPIQFTCNCSAVKFVGEFCEFAKGEIDVRLLSTDSFNVLVGLLESYEIIVSKIGDNPHIIVDMGDGFHFRVTQKSLALGSRQVKMAKDLDFDTKVHFFFKFTHKYTKEGQYLLRAFITNGDPNLIDSPDQINHIYLSASSSQNITAKVPVELKCIPEPRLINVAPLIDDSTLYTRTNEFTVEASLDPSCDEIADFKYTWNLHKLDLSPFPNPSAENNWHIEKITDVSQKFVTFKPYDLLNGRYEIEYVIFVEINGVLRSNSAKGYFNIELNPPKIVIHGGSDRSVDVGQETTLDAFESVDQSFPELSHELSFQWRCEPPCDLGGPWDGPVLKIPPESMISGTEYNFHVDVSLHHKDIMRSSLAMVRLMGSRENLFVECVESCDQMNPGNEILLFCSCSSCSTPPEVEFSWEPISDGVVPIAKQNTSFTSIRLPNRTKGDNTRGVAICKATRSGIVAKLNIGINTPPWGGDCDIVPHDGVYLKTKFNISCEGFMDEDTPLEYSFYAFTDVDQAEALDSLYLLAHDTNPKATNVYLPYNPNGGNTVVVVKVTDFNELSTIKRLNVLMSLPDAEEYSDLLINLINGNNSLMKRRQAFGDYQGALQLHLIVLHGIINNQFTTVDERFILELRNMISSALADQPMHSFKAIEQVLQSLYLLKLSSMDDNLEMLNKTSAVFFQGAILLEDLVSSSVGLGTQIIPKENVKILARAAVDCAIRILRTSYDNGLESIKKQPQSSLNERILTDFDSEDDIERDYFFEINDLEDDFELDDEEAQGVAEIIRQYAKICRLAFTGLEFLLDAVGERLEDGNNFTVTTADATVYLKSISEVDPAGLSVKLKTGSGQKIELKLSGALDVTLSPKGISQLLIQVLEVIPNPFFDDSSVKLGTPVVSVVVKDKTPGEERLSIHLDKLDKPFEYFIPLNYSLVDASKSGRSVVLQPLDEMRDSDLQPFYLILPYNAWVEMFISDFSIDMEFSVVVSRDFWPTKQDFCNPQKRKILNNDTGYSMVFKTDLLGLNMEQVNQFTEYYVGIYPFQQGVFNVLNNFSVNFTRRGCLYRDENKKTWSEGGCIIGNRTTASNLHCICNHASIFGGTQFIVPNEIPTISILKFAPDKFERNSTVLIAICVVIFAYLLGMIICWMLDRRDSGRRVGITIMADVKGISEHSYYLITILTGSRFQSGTTANVSVQLYGTLSRSPVYVLKENMSPVLLRGGTDTFLVSSVKDLGEIEKIRVWHDNFGNSPNWFCRKIIVRNVKTDREWFFFMNYWLQVSGAESTIILEPNSVTEAELRRFILHFEENLLDLLDTSNWISLCWCRAASRFTRCQRLSRDFAVLAVTMILNMIFWFFEEDRDDFTCNFLVYLYALVTSVLVLPVGYIIMFMFRFIRRRFIPTLVVKGHLCQHEELETVGTSLPSQKRPARPKLKHEEISRFKNLRTRNLSIGDSGDFEDKSDASSNFSIPSTNIEDLQDWISQTGKESHKIDQNYFKESEKNESEFENDQSDADTNISDNQCSENHNLNFEAVEMIPKYKNSSFLPWWFIYIAWLLCLGLIVLCLCLSLIFGNRISYMKTQNWLIGIASSLVFSIIIFQPLSTLVLAFVLAISKAKSMKLFEKRFQIVRKENADTDTLDYKKKLRFNIFQPVRMHVPLTGNDIFRFRFKARRRERLKRFLLKLFFCGFQLIPLLIIAYSGPTRNMFMVVTNLRGTLKLDRLEPRYGKFRSFMAVGTDEKLLEYLENVFIGVVYPDSLYNGERVQPKRFDPIYLSDGESLLLGVPRIRQVRVREESCNVPSSAANTFSSCFSPYRGSTRDTVDYNPFWRPIVNGIRSTPPVGNDIWKHQEYNPGFIKSLQTKGEMGYYDGGGYVAELGRRKRETLNVLKYLNRSGWIDHQTRGVFIEFTIWNPNVDIYADVLLLYERGPAHTAHTQHYIKPVVLTSTDCLKADPWLVISHGILLVSLFVLIYIFSWNIFSSSELRVYENLWFWIDFVVICSILISLLLATKDKFVSSEVLEAVQTMKINQFISLQLVAYWNDLSSAAFSITQCICFMRMWRIFILMDKRFYVAFQTVKLASATIVAYFTVILVILVAFACAGHFIFGSDLLEFDSFTDSLISLADQALGANFFVHLQSNHRILGPIYSCIFGFIVTIVSLHLLLYIMNLSLHHAKQITQEKLYQWSYWTTFKRVLSRSQNDPVLCAEISSDHLEEMKTVSTEYFHICLKSNQAETLKALKQCTNKLLQGSGYHVTIRKPRHVVEEFIKETKIIEMRTTTAEFLISRIGTEMNSEEFENYADFNRAVVWLRVQKLEDHLVEIARTVKKLR